MKILQHSQVDIQRIVNKAKRSLFRPFVLANLLEVSFVNELFLLSGDTDFSLDKLCGLYPHRVKKLFHHLNLMHPGLELVRMAVEQQNWVLACERLAEYYQHHELISRVKRLNSIYYQQIHQEISQLCPARILENTFTFQCHTSQVPYCSDGHLNWVWRGDRQDKEWAWFLNRHYHLLNLFQAYEETRHPKYTQYLNQHLLDWISASFTKADLSWALWRGREVALRAFHWMVLFYGLPEASGLTPSVRILMLSSLLDHAGFLRRLHHSHSNWICREMSGLVMIASGWKEFKQAPNWLNYALTKATHELEWQIYPDGVHKELTSHYHQIVLQDFQKIATILQLTHHPVPDLLHSRIEQMVDYLAYSSGPDGRLVQNNDSDHVDNRRLLWREAIAYERPEWQYIATQGRTGEKPQKLSVGFPWAGQVVSRSSWEPDAHWSFFDIGSLGINYHVHYDKLHLSVAAFGRHLLVDGGRYCYKRNRFWRYFRHSASHNVVLIDGKGQGLECREQQNPLNGHYVITPQFDFAWGKFSGAFPGLRGMASHTRALLYIRNRYWVVVDYIETDRPRKIEPLWHFHPDCTVKIAQESVVSVDPDVGNLRILPLAIFPWQVQLISGQTHPIQGWWSREYNHLVPNPTAVYSATIPVSTIFAWVLYPAIGEVPVVDAQILSITSGAIKIEISEASQKKTQITVCLGGKDSIPLSDRLVLKGICAVLTDDQLPVVEMGTFFDSNGGRAASHSQANPSIMT